MVESYAALTPQALANHLAKSKKPLVLVQAIQERAAQQRAFKRSDTGTRRTHKELWGNLLFPLRYERNNVKAGIKYAGDGARGEAMHSYLIVLEELLYRLNRHATARILTPRQLCKERNDSGKGAHIPNAGTHWSDWVPQHIKLRVCVLFDAIPYKQRAKRKLPFQRAIPPLLYSRLYVALGLRTQGFLSAAQRKHAVAPTEETAATVAAIQQALAVLQEWPRNTALPYAWQGLTSIKQRENGSPSAESGRPLNNGGETPHNLGE